MPSATASSSHTVSTKWPSRKQNTDTGTVDSSGILLSTMDAIVEPSKKKVKASTNQPVLIYIRECHAPERLSEKDRISKDIANKRQTTAEKKQIGPTR